jgi:hypothetical protein
MELKGELDEALEATVIEAKMDKGLGVVVTALVQKGIMRSGQTVIAGPSYGRIRFILDDKGKAIPEAYPSQPIRVSSFDCAFFVSLAGLLTSFLRFPSFSYTLSVSSSNSVSFVLCLCRLLGYHVYQLQVKKYY